MAPPANVAIVTLTSAQLQALNTTPVTIVAAPGVNKIICLHRVIYAYRFSTTPFADSGSGMELKYTDQNGVLADGLGLDFLNGTANLVGSGFVERLSRRNTTLLVNAPLVLVNVGPALGGGDGTLTLTVPFFIANAS